MTTIDRTLEHFLTIEQDISGVNLAWLLQDVVDVLSLEQVITVNVTRTRGIEHQLIFVQLWDYVKTGTNDFDASAHSFLVFEQEITYQRVIDESLEHTLEIIQTITPSGIHNKYVEHELTFTQDIEYDADNLLTVYDVTHDLTIEQWVTGDGKTLFTSPQFPTFERTREIEHELEIEQSISVFGTFATLCDPKFEHQPTGSPLGAPPTLTPAGTITLEYPPTSTTHTVTLRSPLIGNQEEIAAVRIQRKTQGGKLITFADSSWVGYRIFRLKFEALTDAQRIAFFDFLSASLGRPIKFTDHESRVWTGVLSSTNPEVSTFNQLCGHTAEFNFETVPNTD